MPDKKLAYDLSVEPSGDLDAPDKLADGIETMADAAEKAAPALDRVENAARGAGQGLDKAGDEAQDAGQQATRAQTRFERLRGTLSDLKGLFLGGLGLGAILEGFKRLVTGGAEFEEQIKRVGEISGASAQDLERIKSKALELGETTSKTATDAAAAAEVLVRSGQSVEQALATLPPVLALAEAEGLSLAASADIVVGSLAAYGRGAQDAVAQTDLLFKTSKSAKTDVSALGAAWAEAGPLAKAAGQDFETTAASLGVLADAQLEGTKGGTALKTILASLASVESPRARQALADLGLTADDVNPSMVDLVDVVERLSGAGLNMNHALALVGREGASALLNLASKKEKLGQLRDELKNLDNDTQRAAASIRDQLKGDLQGLGSVIQTITLVMAQKMSPSLRSATQDLSAFLRSQDAEHFGKVMTGVVEQIRLAVVFLHTTVMNSADLVIGNYNRVKVAAFDLVSDLKKAFGDDEAARRFAEMSEQAADAATKAYERVQERGHRLSDEVSGSLKRLDEAWHGTTDTMAQSGNEAAQNVETLGGKVDTFAQQGAKSVNRFEQAWIEAITGISASAKIPQKEFEQLVDFMSRLDFASVSQQLTFATPEMESRIRQEFQRLAELLAQNAETLPQVVHDNLQLVAAELGLALPEALDRVGVSVDQAVQRTADSLSGFGELATLFGTDTQKAVDAMDQGATGAEQASLKWVQTADGLKLIHPRLEKFADDVEDSQQRAADGLEHGANAAEAVAQALADTALKYTEAGAGLKSGAEQAAEAGQDLESTTRTFGQAAEQAGQGSRQVVDDVGKAADGVQRSAEQAKDSVAQTQDAADTVRVSLEQAEARFNAIKTAIEQPITIQVDVDLSPVVHLRREIEAARADFRRLQAEGKGVVEELA